MLSLIGCLVFVSREGVTKHILKNNLNVLDRIHDKELISVQQEEGFGDIRFPYFLKFYSIRELWDFNTVLFPPF